MEIEKESIILKLYEQTEQEMPNSKDYAELLSKFNVFRDELDNRLAPSQMEDLITLLQIKNNMESITARNFYVEGFKVATRLMTEVFHKEDK